MTKVLVILMERFRALAKPTLYNRISEMKRVSGSTMVTWRKRDFK